MQVFYLFLFYFTCTAGLSDRFIIQNSGTPTFVMAPTKSFGA